MQKSTIVSILVSIALIGGTLYVVSPQAGGESAQTYNIEIRDGVQYVTILAKGGYSPRVTAIQAGMPTKLIMKTDDTFDCSASLVIHSLGYQKMLEPGSEETIDLGTPQSGDTVQGVCSMGMYNFLIQASS